MNAACKEAVAPPQFLTNWQSAAVLSVCLLVCMGVFQTVQSDTATLNGALLCWTDGLQFVRHGILF